MMNRRMPRSLPALRRLAPVRPDFAELESASARAWTRSAHTGRRPKRGVALFAVDNFYCDECARGAGGAVAGMASRAANAGRPRERSTSVGRMPSSRRTFASCGPGPSPAVGHGAATEAHHPRQPRRQAGDDARAAWPALRARTRCGPARRQRSQAGEAHRIRRTSGPLRSRRGWVGAASASRARTRRGCTCTRATPGCSIRREVARPHAPPVRWPPDPETKAAVPRNLWPLWQFISVSDDLEVLGRLCRGKVPCPLDRSHIGLRVGICKALCASGELDRKTPYDPRVREPFYVPDYQQGSEEQFV